MLTKFQGFTVGSFFAFVLTAFVCSTQAKEVGEILEVKEYCTELPAAMDYIGEIQLIGERLIPPPRHIRPGMSVASMQSVKCFQHRMTPSAFTRALLLEKVDTRIIENTGISKTDYDIKVVVWKAKLNFNSSLGDGYVFEFVPTDSKCYQFDGSPEDQLQCDSVEI